MNCKILNNLKLIFSLLLFVSINFVVKKIFYLFGVNINNFSLLTKTVIELSISLFLTFLLIIIYYKDIKKDFVDFKINWKSKILYSLKIFGMFLLISIIQTIFAFKIVDKNK